jgi:riboflavin synthase
MFTGIIETLGTVSALNKIGSNTEIQIQSNISPLLKIDQSIAHNGVCLTVTKIHGNTHSVIAVEETLYRSNLGNLFIGDEVNLERAMTMQQRMDGHIVQGHVDDVVECLEIKEADGSWYFTFSYPEDQSHLLVDKGSVCINGVSLTTINPAKSMFMVAIIPYTYEHTTFKNLKIGDFANIEYDILGKYVARYMETINSR